MPGTAGGTRSRRRRPILSIRARLIVLALLAVGPLMLERVHALSVARTEHTEHARAEVLELARRGAEAQRDIVYSVRALLQIVARVYAELPPEAANCGRYLGDVTANIPWLRSISIVTAGGRIRCSTEAAAIGLDVSDRPHFQNALRARDFTLSDYIIGRVGQIPSLIATFPVLAAGGSLDGVVLAAVNLPWIGDLAVAAAQRPGASVLLLDDSGVVIAASQDGVRFVGQSVADRELTRAMLSSDEGGMTGLGLDGIARIFAFVRVPWTQARLAVGLDEAAVHSDIDHDIGVACTQLALFLVFVLLLAWFGGEQLIVRPIRMLVRTATRFGRGDLHVRATEEPWVAEFAPLAEALDDMAGKLAAREEDLRIANQHLDELASLDGLSGLANRRGFDRELEREWQRAAERGEPLALMMIDIDHFKLFNDRYGHVAGDTCLRAVAETLSLVTVESAVIVARYGGEEFALLLPGLDITRVQTLAEEARRTVEDLQITHAESEGGIVTVSIGVESVIPKPGQSSADLVEAADRALYDAKRRGRNMVVPYERILLSAAS